MTKFSDLGLSKQIISALTKKGFEEPTPIQAQCIPLLLNGDKDIMGQAQTGTGKTAAFGLPILDKTSARSKKVQALILAPTRELAIQVADELNSLKGEKKLNIISVYGGQSIGKQMSELERGAQVVVGTPGRVLDLLKRKKLVLEHLDFFILDEADEMLNMGFIDDIESIMDQASDEKRMLLFSATMPKRILGLIKKYMPTYEHVKIENKELTTNLVEQKYFQVSMRDRVEALGRILELEEHFHGFIFCRTRNEVDEVALALVQKGYKVEAVHGGVSQEQREKIFNKFRKKQVNILVATDVAARGISVENLSHVINYSLPQDAQTYVHRIGRTGRAGQSGIAITFVTSREARKIRNIERVTKKQITREELPKIEKVIEQKKVHFLQSISNIIENSNLEYFHELSESLLNELPVQDVIPALLKYIFGEQLNPHTYKEINSGEKGERSKDGKRKFNKSDFDGVRLFIAKGKKDRMRKRDIVDFVSKRSKVRGQAIDDVVLKDKFAFVTVSENDAQKILNSFRGVKENGRSVIIRAKR